MESWQGSTAGTAAEVLESVEIVYRIGLMSDYPSDVC